MGILQKAINCTVNKMNEVDEVHIQTRGINQAYALDVRSPKGFRMGVSIKRRKSIWYDFLQ